MMSNRIKMKEKKKFSKKK